MNKACWFIVGAVAGFAGSQFCVKNNICLFEKDSDDESSYSDLINKWGEGLQEGIHNAVSEIDSRRDANRTWPQADHVRISNIIHKNGYSNKPTDNSESVDQSGDSHENEASSKSVHMVDTAQEKFVTNSQISAVINDSDQVSSEVVKGPQNASQSLSGAFYDDEIPENVQILASDDDLDNFVPITEKEYGVRKNTGEQCLSFVYDIRRDAFYKRRGIEICFNDPIRIDEMQTYCGYPVASYVRHLAQTNGWVEPKFVYNKESNFYVSLTSWRIDDEKLAPNGDSQSVG